MARRKTDSRNQATREAALPSAPGSVICPDISEMRIAAHRAGLAGKSDREIALEMQRFIGKEKARLGQTVPNHWYGFELTAQWLEWFAVDSKNAEESLQYAQNQRRLAEDMKARPDYYARRDSGQYTHWQWFQLSAPNDQGQP